MGFLFFSITIARAVPSLVPVIVWSGSRHHHIYPYPAHTPHLPMRTHCTRYLTVYVHIHNFSTLSTYPASLSLPLLCPQSSSHLPLKSAFLFPFLPSVYLFPIYYTIKQKLCNPFFPFLSSITRSYYTCYYYREAYSRQAGFPFFFIYLFFYTSTVLLYTLFYQIVQSHHHCFLSPFQKYYMPFFCFLVFGLIFFFPFNYMHAWVPVDGGRECGRVLFLFSSFIFIFVFTQKRDQTRISQMMNASSFPFTFPFFSSSPYCSLG